MMTRTATLVLLLLGAIGGRAVDRLRPASRGRAAAL